MSTLRVLTRLGPKHLISRISYQTLIPITFTKTPESSRLPTLSQRPFGNISNSCWECGTVIDTTSNLHVLFCPKCETVQKLDDASNYFTVLGVKREFDLDLLNLQQKYRHLQTFLHPDKFSMRSEKERDLSAEWSSAINKAYETLKNPLKRGLHLLQLRGDTIDGEIASPEFLSKVMGMFEQVEDASTLEELRQLLETNEEYLKTYRDKITKFFSEDNYIEAKKNLVEMKYYESINQEIKDEIDTIFYGKN